MNPFVGTTWLFILIVVSATVLPVVVGWYANALVAVFFVMFLWLFGGKKPFLVLGLMCALAGELLLGYRLGILMIPFIVLAIVIFFQTRFLQFNSRSGAGGLSPRKLSGASLAAVPLYAVFSLLSLLVEKLIYRQTILWNKLWIVWQPWKTALTVMGLALAVVWIMCAFLYNEKSRYY